MKYTTFSRIKHTSFSQENDLYVFVYFFDRGITKCRDMLVKFMLDVKSERIQKHGSLLQTQIQDEQYFVARGCYYIPLCWKGEVIHNAFNVK